MSSRRAARGPATCSSATPTAWARARRRTTRASGADPARPGSGTPATGYGSRPSPPRGRRGAATGPARRSSWTTRAIPARSTSSGTARTRTSRRRHDSRREAGGLDRDAGARFEHELSDGVVLVGEHGMAAGVGDRDLVAVRDHGPVPLGHDPYAARLVGPLVEAEVVGRLRMHDGAGFVFGAQRREHVLLDAEQLLDRVLGLVVGALAVVVLE